jgi:hypothetical protein
LLEEDVLMASGWMTRLSEDLGLKEHLQDWGTCNADPERLLEFIDFFERHQPEHPEEPEALAELIIASFNEGQVEGITSEINVEAFKAFIALNRESFPEQFTYWSEFDDPDFPVGLTLKEIEAS